MIDIGVNLLHAQFEADRQDVLTRARQAGVEQMLVTATDLVSARAALSFCSAHDLYCTAGVHPHDAAATQRDYLETLAGLAAHPRVKAVGETGLDFNRNFSPPEVQRRIFAEQILLAREIGKPLFVHDRDSNGEVRELLANGRVDADRVVIHCFTGNGSELDTYLADGFSIGITGWICDHQRGAQLRNLVSRIPLERLMLETDAPFLLPKGLTNWPPDGVPRKHKRRNEPCLLPIIVDTVAALMNIDREEVVNATSANARRLFDLPQPA